MRSLIGSVLAALSAGTFVRVQLLRIDFTSGSIALNTSNWDVEYAGTLYRGAYGLGSISAITDAPGGAIKGITLEMITGDSGTIALALDEADEVQGAPIVVCTAIFDPATYQVLDAPIDFAGLCDTMQIEEGGSKVSITVTAESNAVDLLRSNPSTYSDADQQALYPGDRAFEYVVDQVDKPLVWPSREYFFQ